MRPVRQPRILVAEDDRVLQDLVAELLVEAGYDVTTASDGDEALKIVREQSPDLVLLDVMMPRMDGFEMLRRLKADPETADVRVVMLTARSLDQDILQGERFGAELYITKPFAPLELSSLVEKVLGSAG